MTEQPSSDAERLSRLEARVARLEALIEAMPEVYARRLYNSDIVLLDADGERIHDPWTQASGAERTEYLGKARRELFGNT